MFEVSSEASFSAAHRLNNYNGPCENTHGHNWLVRATVRCEKINEIGIGIDFKKLKSELKTILAILDHCDLNTVFDELNINPSSENIARYIYEKLSESITEPHSSVCRIDVYETPGNCASYFEND